MEKPTEAFPLAWPMGWRRTSAHQRTRAKFGRGKGGWRGGSPEAGEWVPMARLSIADGTTRVLLSLQRMGFSSSVIVSTNLKLRRDGLPLSAQREPEDPGVAVYWGIGKAARCMAVDMYDRVADNLAAIAATLEAMRAIQRHGGAAILERAFSGFIALPAPEQSWQVLGLNTSAPTREAVELAHRLLAMKHHPDRPGGDADLMARINRARDDLLERLG